MTRHFCSTLVQYSPSTNCIPCGQACGPDEVGSEEGDAVAGAAAALAKEAAVAVPVAEAAAWLLALAALTLVGAASLAEVAAAVGPPAGCVPDEQAAAANKAAQASDNG